jgi:SAM-dependent methyltransferase
MTGFTTHNAQMNLLGFNKTVTREDVLWCYRNILRREPESEAAITPHLLHKSFRSLAESFANSDEGRKPVTRDDVVWCYRNILGREPEEDEPIEHFLSHRHFRELVTSFAHREGGLRAVTRNDVLWGYRHILRREPESNAAIDVQQNVASFRQLVESMGNSEEVVHPITPADVLWCYRNILGREPEPDEPFEPHLAHKDFQSLAQSFANRGPDLRAVTREDVRWCYRHILGRDVESEEAETPHLAHKTFRDLVTTLANCAEAAEFRDAAREGLYKRIKRQQALLSAGLIPSNIMEARGIDSVASASELAACLHRVKSAWAQHEKTARNDSEDGRSINADAAEKVLSLFRAHQESENFPGTFVEFGSGTGELAIALASCIQTINAYGLSTVSLERARSRAIAEGASNITFHECDEQSLKSLPACDYFYSMSTLQFLPPPLAATMIRNALRALQPGGLAAFQLMTALDGYTLKLADWLGQMKIELTTHVLPDGRVREIIFGQRCELLSLENTDLGNTQSSVFVAHKPR